MTALSTDDAQRLAQREAKDGQGGGSGGGAEKKLFEWTVPMVLTWFRILLIPFFIGLFYVPHIDNDLPVWVNVALLSIFVVASLTDFFDGYLARKFDQTSAFGAFLDPVADKLIVAAALIYLACLDRTPAIFAAIIIGREITISALREWMAQIGRRNSVAVARLGKIKTAAQMVAICLLLLFEVPVWGWSLYWLGNAIMLVATALTIWSMFHYLRVAGQEFKKA